MSLDGPGWITGGAGGIRTLDTVFQPYNGLANRRLQPLGHSSAYPRIVRGGGTNALDRLASQARLHNRQQMFYGGRQHGYIPSQGMVARCGGLAQYRAARLLEPQ